MWPLPMMSLVSNSSHGNLPRPNPDPPVMFKLVQLGPHHTGTTPTPTPRDMFQASLLCSPYCQHADGWHSTEMPSCLHFQIDRQMETCGRKETILGLNSAFIF